MFTRKVVEREGCSQLEIRGANHQTALPPSTHPNGGRYVFPGGVLPPEGPATLPAELILRLADKTPTPEQSSAPGDPAEGTAQAEFRQLIETEMDKVRRAPEGERNDQLNRSAYRLGLFALQGLSRGLAEPLLRKAA